jgi:uncharacterized protein YegP (UPF0339 family)
MTGKFELKKSTDGKFIFNLKAGNGEVILSSETYNSKQSAQTGIEAVKQYTPLESHYERKTSTRGERYFILKAPNREIIGTSEMYSSSQAMENGIKAVKETAPTASISDLT